MIMNQIMKNACTLLPIQFIFLLFLLLTYKILPILVQLYACYVFVYGYFCIQDTD